MSATRYPFQMAGGVPVVRAPAEIDTATAGQLRAILEGRPRIGAGLTSGPRASVGEGTVPGAYQACLVGQTTGETFGRAVTFLRLTGANAASATVISADTRR